MIRISETIAAQLLEDDEVSPELDPRELVDLALQANQQQADEFKRSGVVNAETADLANTFYHRKLKYKRDPSRPLECRRNGKTKRWKSRPDQFRIPVKYGMYEYFYIDNSNAHEWSTVPDPAPTS